MALYIKGSKGEDPVDQAYGFQSAGNDYHNYRGYGEKYFVGNGNAWFSSPLSRNALAS